MFLVTPASASIPINDPQNVVQTPLALHSGDEQPIVTFINVFLMDSRNHDENRFSKTMWTLATQRKFVAPWIKYGVRHLIGDSQFQRAGMWPLKVILNPSGTDVHLHNSGTLRVALMQPSSSTPLPHKRGSKRRRVA